MKKIYTLFLLAGFANMNAQVPNNSFEELTGYGNDNIASWGMFFPIQVSIDLGTGETIPNDTILFDSSGGFSAPVTNAHTGAMAMEVHNAYNETANVVIPGVVNLFNSELSQDPSGWNNGVPIQVDSVIEFLGFYYQFSPIGSDIAVATMAVFTDQGETLGTATVDISQATSGYSYVSAPFITTEVTGAPAFMTIQFNMAKEGSVPTFGTRLIVDDVVVNSDALQTIKPEANTFMVYPTITNGLLNITRGNAAATGTLSINDINGRIIKSNIAAASTQIDVSALAPGLYFLRSDNGAFTAKFIKK